jgi:hypothetical protein
MAKNLKIIADVFVAAAKAGEPWAVTLALRGMLPKRLHLVDEPIDRPPLSTVDGAVGRIAETVAGIETGALGLDEAAALIQGAQAFVAAKAQGVLEQKVADLQSTVERLTALVEAGALTRKE